MENPLPLPRQTIIISVKEIQQRISDDALHDRFVCSKQRYFAIGRGLDVIKNNNDDLRLFNTYYCGDEDPHAPDRESLTKIRTSPKNCGSSANGEKTIETGNRTLKLTIEVV